MELNDDMLKKDRFQTTPKFVPNSTDELESPEMKRLCGGNHKGLGCSNGKCCI